MHAFAVVERGDEDVLAVDVFPTRDAAVDHATALILENSEYTEEEARQMLQTNQFEEGDYCVDITRAIVH